MIDCFGCLIKLNMSSTSYLVGIMRPRRMSGQEDNRSQIEFFSNEYSIEIFVFIHTLKKCKMFILGNFLFI